MRKTLPLILGFLMLACSCLTNAVIPPASIVPPTATTEPAKISSPTATDTPTAEPTATVTPTDEPTATPGMGFTIVRVYPSDGNLNEQLAEEVRKAKTMGQDAYVEFEATWCPSCQAIETSLDEGDPLMVDAFQGVYLVRADIDEWDHHLWGTGFEFSAIPIFFELNAQGRPTGRSIDGSAWEENTPENMAPPLKEFFQSQ